jgi:N-acyl-D-amino-acid deacylase
VIDVLIHGATVIDGSGSVGYRAAVGIADDRLTIIRGNVEDVEVRRSIDATGMVVAPGFIDMHSHSGLVIFEEPTHEAKLRQGVTTELIGVDGISYAPFTDRADLEDLVVLNAGLDGRPDVRYDWDTVASYLSRFDRRVSPNIAFVIGNSALRICTVGWEAAPADADAVKNMRALLREGMEEGAYGLSTGLDYPPGSHATTDELAELSAEAAALGGIYHTHVRYQLGDQFLDPFREAVEIGRRSGCPVHITHLYRRVTAPGGATRLLDLVEDAVAEGLDVTFDAYPYPWNSTRLLILLPLWIQEGRPVEVKERLADPALRDRLRRDVEERGRRYGGRHLWGSIRLGYFSRPENAGYEGKTLLDVMQDRDQHPADAMCELLLSEDLRVNQVASSPDPATLPLFVRHPLGMVGTDSVFLGQYPSPRTYGSFPRILGDLVREERLLSLPEAIRKMTSFAAQRLGLPDRGLLRDGFKADVVVFDADAVRSNATYHDPRQYPDGIPYVLVNGEVVIDGGRHTGATPGRALRYRRGDR